MSHSAEGLDSVQQLLTHIPELDGRPNWIILPVALPGAGSTDLVAAIERLFHFTRVKLPVSATIAREQRAPEEICTIEIFQSRVAAELEKHHVVLADSNNHLARHREVFRSVAARVTPRAQLLALNWDISPLSSSTVHSICCNRVQGSTSLSATDIWRYIRTREVLEPGEVDVYIDLRLNDDPWTTFARAVDGIVQTLQLQRPDPRSMHQASRLLYERQSANPHGLLPSGPRRNLSSSREDHDKLASLVHRASIMARTSNPIIVPRQFKTPEGVAITCWKTQKTAYYKLPNELPFLARGFWTRRIVSRSKVQNYAPEVRHEVVVRGYDKFFAINEMPWVTWDLLRRYTHPPYHVTAKLDGCLIMVSSVTRGQLLVTSKHSLGPQSHRTHTHAQIGEQWLSKQLEKVKRSRSELAMLLRERNWTLMCELLDDSFEEHVIAVPVERAGLHLHGINSRTVKFKTEDPAAVQAFAKEWGFFSTSFVTLPSLDDVMELVLTCKTGRWNGEHLPGLVIRTRVKDTIADDPDGSERLRYPPPCEEGSPFFFASKFRQPFELWHGYRQITQFAIRGHKTSTQRFPAAPQRFEWIAYASWVDRQIKTESALRDELAQGRGYIALRKQFISWTTETAEGIAALHEAMEVLDRAKLHDSPRGLSRPAYGTEYKWLILLVGLPGCGKTVLSRALARLFGFKHIELGTCTSKTARIAKRELNDAVGNSFTLHDVVIADAHCHRAARREKMRRASLVKRPKLLALEWQAPSEVSTSERICSMRLAVRDALPDRVECDRTVRRFRAEYEPLRDGEVNFVIPIDYSDRPLDTLNRVVTGISTIMGIRPPSTHLVEEAACAIGEGMLVDAVEPASTHYLSDRRRSLRGLSLIPTMSDELVPCPPTPTFVPFKTDYLEAYQAAVHGSALTPPLPSRGRFLGTVKLHGTQAKMVFRDNNKRSPQLQSRRRVIDIERDNFGTAALLSHVPLHELVDQILEISGAKTFEEIMVAGEMAGTGIMKGVAIAHVPRLFAIFNIRIDGAWVDMRRYASVALHHYRIFNLAAWPTYEVDIDFTMETSAVSAKISALTDEVVRACPVGLALADEVQPAKADEAGIRAGKGIVWTLVESLDDDVPLNRAKLYAFKTKGAAFATTAHAPKVTPSADKLSKAQAFARYALGERRFEQGIEFVEETLVHEGKAGQTAYQFNQLEAFTTWVVKNAFEEERRAMREMGVDKTLLWKVMRDMAASWFRAQVNAVSDACTLPQ